MSQDGKRTIGLWGATGVGVGAIVGGGILVLAGTALSVTGPGAVVAFAINGVVAFLTAMSFAEMSAAFPESGGAYTYAKKVLSVRAAFGAGWILWFAYIVAGVLYALGFASFGMLFARDLCRELGVDVPALFASRQAEVALAVLASGGYAISLIRKESGGGQYATIGKVVVFLVLIVVGVVVFVGSPLEETTSALSPFFPGGMAGLVSAMGFTFIALQGFDLIGAIAGEIKEPERNIPRAMFMSLGLALVIYLPLLLIVSSVGVAPGQKIAELAASDPDTIIAASVRQYMGPVGYWLVILAAILSTLSALHANLLAASRVALSMSVDRTLPAVFGRIHSTFKTPAMAIYASALALVAVILIVPNLAAAGAAASLIFLLSFGLAHVTAFLARRRAVPGEARYQAPLFPLVPVVGGGACALLAIYQGVMVPSAGAIVAIWLGLGVVLYFALFASAAEVVDASSEGNDRSLIRLRGRNPLVLLPIANPSSAEAMVAVANGMVPERVGRVMLLSVVALDDNKAMNESETLERISSAQEVVKRALSKSYTSGFVPEALVTAAADPWAEIHRVADAHNCESLLIGLGTGKAPEQLETLMAEVDRDVAVMKVPDGWRLDEARRILVPIGGRGAQHEVRARLLSSICRSANRHVTFVRVLPTTIGDKEARDAERALERLAEVKVRSEGKVEVVRDDDAAGRVIAMASDYDLVVLGLTSVGGLRHVGDVRSFDQWKKLEVRRRRVLGDFAQRIASEAPCAVIMLSARLTTL